MYKKTKMLEYAASNVFLESRLQTGASEQHDVMSGITSKRLW